jgi:hypothetical protein
MQHMGNHNNYKQSFVLHAFVFASIVFASIVIPSGATSKLPAQIPAAYYDILNKRCASSVKKAFMPRLS